MKKPRIIITCPSTGIAVITAFDYADMVGDRQPAVFRCPCGEVHKLRFVGSHANVREQLGSDRQSVS